MLLSVMTAHSEPPPAYKQVRMGSMRLTRASFEAGMWQDHQLPAAPGGRAEMEVSSILLGGRLIDPAGVLPVRAHGWISDIDTYPIPAGVHRSLAAEPTELWTCRPIVQNLSMDMVDAVRLEFGQELAMQQGDQLMLVSGRVEVADRTIAAPQLLSMSSRGWLVTALEETYAFVWRT